MEPHSGFPFHFYCQKVLPAVYDDSLSYYEVLCKLTDTVNKFISAGNTDIEDLQKAYQELYDYVHGTAWEDAICQWVNDNLPCIVAQTCKWFHFGISDNGNVVCIIPTTWQNFVIHWDMDFGSPDFGKLTIGWE